MNMTVESRLTVAIPATLALPASLAHAGEGIGEPFGLSMNLATTRVSPAFGNVAKAGGSQGEPEPLKHCRAHPRPGASGHPIPLHTGADRPNWRRQGGQPAGSRAARGRGTA